jgi:PAS domain S-box-containing protein
MFFDRLANLLIKDGKKNWPVISASALLILSPLILTAILTYSKTRQDLTAFTLSQRQTVAYLATTTLKEKLDRLLDITVSLASRVRFRQLVTEGKWDEAIRILGGVPKDFPFIDRLFLADLEGILMSDIPALPDVRGNNFATRDWYRGISRNWKPYVSEVYQRAALPRHNIVAAAAPIKTERGKLVGILVVQVKLDSLLDWTKQIDVGDKGFVFVVDKNARIAAHPKLNLQAEIADYSKVPAVQKVLRGAKGVETLPDPIGTEPQLFAYQPVAEYGWGVIVQQPTSAAFALRDSSLRRVLITYGLILILNCGLAYLILSTLIKVKRGEEIHSKLASIVESSEDAIISTTLDGKIVTWNKGAENVYGYSGQEAIGRSVSLVDSPDQPNEISRILEKIRRGHAVDRYVTAGMKKDGQRIDVSLSASPIRDASGKIVRVSAIARDITQRKQLQEELREKNRELEQQNYLVQKANRLKSEFLANMSHELRTPLNAIIGFAQLMHDGKVGPVSTEHKEYLGDILTSGRHLLQLINDILDLSKIEAGKLEFNPEPVHLTALIGEVRQILQSLSAAKRLSVAVEISPSIDELVIDPAKLKQVLYNYLSNAIKFTPEQGRVTIRALPEASDFFRLEVEDTGIGIPPQDLNKLFTEFQQLDTSTTKRHQGTGLGLALTKKIVAGQGGRVGVESVQGRGSVFYAILPRVASAQKEPAANSLPSGLSTPNGPRVLIVEDNEKDRGWLVNILSQAGYSTDTAKTGAEALAKVDRETYTAILLDLILPDMIGWDVLHATRTKGSNQHTPVIVVTLVTEKEIAKGFPVQDCLAKPVPPDVLIGSLRRAGLHPNGAAKKILVIDDDPNALKIASAALRSSGYEAVCHTSATAGLTAASESKFSAVVLDLLMPEIDGFEFLDRFRKMSTCQNIPVIVWTNKDITPRERDRLERSTQSIALKGHDGIDTVLRELQRHVDQTPRRPASSLPGDQTAYEY